MNPPRPQRLGRKSALVGLAALIAGAVPLMLVNHCAQPCQIPASLGIAVICAGLFLLLTGIVTAISGVLRIDRRTYVVVAGTVLAIAAAMLIWFALTFNPLF